MFRMHPNAEIGYLSTASTDLFATIMVLEKGGGTCCFSSRLLIWVRDDENRTGIKI